MALSAHPVVCQALQFSYGVEAVALVSEPDDWCQFARDWLRLNEVPGPIAVLVAGPSERHPEANYRIEFLSLGERGPAGS